MATDPGYANRAITNNGPKSQTFSSLLTNSTGAVEATADYSSTGSNHTFTIAPSTGEIIDINRMLTFVRDTGAFAAEKYGYMTAFTNGIEIRKADSTSSTGTLIDLTDSYPIKTNTDWARVCYDATISDFGVGDQYLHTRWTFAKSGAPIRLVGDNGEFLEVSLHDSCTGLNQHNFTVQGFYEGVSQ